MPNSYLVFKALHIVFMVTWFAGLFYLPRLFIYHSEAKAANQLDEITKQRFITMERKLFIIMSIGMLITILFGFMLLGKNPGVFETGWMHVKLLFVIGLIIYHFYCHKIHREMRDNLRFRSSKWLRFYNEAPAVFLVVIVLMAVLKPF